MSSGEERARLEQAVLWRQAFAYRVEAALELLREAEAGAPTSLERVQVGHAITSAGAALTTARSSIAKGEQQLHDLRTDPGI